MVVCQLLTGKDHGKKKQSRKKEGSTYADDALGPNQLDHVVRHGALGIALTVGLQIAEIADMASFGGAVAVRLVVGVDYTQGWVSASHTAIGHSRWAEWAEW